MFESLFVFVCPRRAIFDDAREAGAASNMNCTNADRRSFLLKLVSQSAAALAAGILQRMTLHGQEAQSRILASVRIADNPDLTKVGGFLLLENTPTGKLLVIRISEKEFAALSPVCPHRKCDVRVVSASLIRCPCHQSAYKIDGTYVSGPAKTSLKKFVTRAADGTVTVLGK